MGKRAPPRHGRSLTGPPTLPPIPPHHTFKLSCTAQSRRYVVLPYDALQQEAGTPSISSTAVGASSERRHGRSGRLHSHPCTQRCACNAAAATPQFVAQPLRPVLSPRPTAVGRCRPGPGSGLRPLPPLPPGRTRARPLLVPRPPSASTITSAPFCDHAGAAVVVGAAGQRHEPRESKSPCGFGGFGVALVYNCMMVRQARRLPTRCQASLCGDCRSSSCDVAGQGWVRGCSWGPGQSPKFLHRRRAPSVCWA